MKKCSIAKKKLCSDQFTHCWWTINSHKISNIYIFTVLLNVEWIIHQPIPKFFYVYQDCVITEQKEKEKSGSTCNFILWNRRKKIRTLCLKIYLKEKRKKNEAMQSSSLLIIILCASTSFFKIKLIMILKLHWEHILSVYL